MNLVDYSSSEDDNDYETSGKKSILRVDPIQPVAKYVSAVVNRSDDPLPSKKSIGCILPPPKNRIQKYTKHASTLPSKQVQAALMNDVADLFTVETGDRDFTKVSPQLDLQLAQPEIPVTTDIVEESVDDKEEEPNVINFNADDFYRENAVRLAQGHFSDSNEHRIHALAGGRHQITSLLRNAQQNQEAVERQSFQNHKKRKDTKAKYAF